MLLDIDGDKKRYEKSTKKQQLQHDNFYWWYARLLNLNDSFKIQIHIVIIELKDNNLLLQKRIKDKDAKKKTIIGMN